MTTTSEITDLPLNGRDFSELAYLTPGVVAAGEGANVGFAAINGGRADGVHFVIDGTNNRSNRAGGPVARPSVDAVQEFKVQTSAYAADYGAVGSGVINIGLRSGTNQLHGTAYHFARNAVFDARGFFATDKRSLSRGQYSGTLGGPLRKDHSFFFGSFEGLRETRSNTQIGTVPNYAQRRGDFSSAAFAIRDPFSGNQPFPNRQIPATLFHPTALRLLKLYPAANHAGVNNFGITLDNLNRGNDFIAKLDQRLGADKPLDRCESVRTQFPARFWQQARRRQSSSGHSFHDGDHTARDE